MTGRIYLDVQSDARPEPRAALDPSLAGTHSIVSVDSDASEATVNTICAPSSTVIASLAWGSSGLIGMATKNTRAGSRTDFGKAIVVLPSFGTMLNRWLVPSSATTQIRRSAP